jgi:hypothetical protein
MKLLQKEQCPCNCAYIERKMKVVAAISNLSKYSNLNCGCLLFVRSNEALQAWYLLRETLA